jgi:CDP-diacylglycerol pyrophosphatase
VVLKSPPYASEFLVTPAIHIEGIESADVLKPDVSQLWQAAWNARALVERALGHSLPASAVGLVVNSAGSRTQDQLHIHVDCASRTTQRVLEEFLPRANDAWQNLPKTIAGNRYVVRLLGSSNLAAVNPFDLLTSALPHDKAIASASLAVVGVGSEHDASDFLVLASFTDKPGEPLLDHTCR